MKNNNSTIHRILERQLRKATIGGGNIDFDILKSLINTTYFEYENTIKLNERAMSLMSHEMNVQNKDLEKHREHLEKLVEERTYELMQAKKKAESNLKVKDEFLSNMSHELRTPLHAILSYSNLALKNTKIQSLDNQEKFLYNIKISGEHLLRLVSNLLDLASIEDGLIELKISKYDFYNDVIQTTLFEMSPLFSKKKINIITEILADDTYAVFDKLRMVQVLVNLLSNSIKFSPENSTIRIKLYKSVLSNGEGKALCLSVSDEGLGIPQEELGLVFNKFTQSSRTRTGAGGTGFGLAMCRQIVEAHSGEVWAENGNTCGVVLNVAIPQHSGGYDMKHIKILAVDDDPSNLEIMREYLTSVGYDVIIAKSGEEALQVLDEKDDIDLILLDRMMPKMNGMEVLDAIKSDKRFHSMQIIMQTAAATQKQIDEGRRPDIYFYLTKPYTEEELLKVVAEAIASKDNCSSLGSELYCKK